MTPQQTEEFKFYGCLSRCLIALASLSGKPITFDEYVNKFGLIFEGKCGNISYGLITEIIRELGIGNTFNIFRDQGRVERCFRENPRPPIILCTEKHPMDYSEFLHSFLIVSMGNNQYQVGLFAGEELYPLGSQVYSSEEIDRLSGFFLVLR